MWLIAETTEGIKLEYWKEHGHCLLSLETEATSASELDKIKAPLNEHKVKPTDAPKFL